MPTVKTSTPAFLRLAASVSVFPVSVFDTPSETRMAILSEFGRDVSPKSPLVAIRSPAAILVSPPPCFSALIAGSRVLMFVYLSKVNCRLARVLNLTTPTRTYVPEMTNRRIRAVTKPITSRGQVSSSSCVILLDSSRINAMSAICSGHSA